MGKATGFMEFSRKNCSREDALSRINHWNEFDTPLTEEERKEQGARCMDCGVPFCQSGIMLNGMATGCPLHNLIPEWNNFVYLGKWKLGLERLLKTSNFPEFTSRVCPALCENACTCGLHGDAVTVKANEKYLIEKGFSEGIIKANPPQIRTGKKVAVIGSGPSGLACSDFLNKLGHSVTVYEREDRVGGLMMYGIPNMKLEKTVIERRVNLLKEEGITFKTCVNVGIDITFNELDKEYDAIVVTIGASKPRDLKVPGRELNGIHFAVKYLTNNTKRVVGSVFNKGADIIATDKDVIVIGGGDTGTDCVGTALRQGCKSVNQFEIMGEPLKTRGENNPWPEYAKILKVDYGQEEYIAKFGHDPRMYLTSVKEFYGDKNGDVKSLKTVDVEWVKDENGRMSLKEIEGSEKIWNADLVLIAMGFTGVEDYIAKDLGVQLNSRGSINATDVDYKTSKDNVFVAGDARRGPSLVVWGIAEGRNAALSVDKYLME